MHRGEVDGVAACLRMSQERADVMAVGFGAVTPLVGAVVENLAEIFKPAAVHHGSVGEDQGALGVHLPGQLEGGERLPEAHLGVPEHSTAAAELRLGHVYGSALLRAEDDGVSPL